MGIDHAGSSEGVRGAVPTGGPRGAWRSTFGLCAALSVGALSLLLWSKLKLVTNVPRTAYAVPEERSDATGGSTASHTRAPSTRDEAAKDGAAVNEPANATGKQPR